MRMTGIPTILMICITVVPFLGAMLTGGDRILTARLQSRIGPPLFQPIYDVVKLLAKEKTIISVWQAFCAYGYLAATMVAVALFCLGSDLLLVLFVQAVGAVFLVIGALASGAPYSQIGAHRELLQLLCCEPLLILVLTGFYLEIGSFRMQAVLDWQQPLLPRLPFLLPVLLFALMIKLRKSPLDLAASRHVHQELVRGLLSDYSGPLLAFIEIGHWYETVLFLGWCGLFWATSKLAMGMMAAGAYVLVILADNVTARLNWRWMLTHGWVLGTSLALINLIWLRL
jgi:ech hydrogenase subunit B